MKNIIITEQSNQSSIDIDISTSLEIVEIINNEDKKIALAIEKEKMNIAGAIDVIAEKFITGGHLLYFGAGTSGRLGVLDASECPPTFGVTPDMVRGYIAGGDVALRYAVEGAEDNYEQGKEDLINSQANENDVVVGISASGNPKWLLGVMEAARGKGMFTIGISSNPSAKIKELSDIFICPVVEQEVVTGSSRMKSGTAQKMILNMLSTGAMIKIGKTYKNFMVDVQPTNEKLKQRAIRFVSEIAQCNEDIAEKALINSDFEVKTAILTLLLNCPPDDAREKLYQNKGVLRKIIN